jgi:hypothetical protein
MEGTMYIRMDELKRFGAPIGGGREWVGPHFASKTWFADGIWWCSGVQHNASYHLLLNHLLDVHMIVVS